MDQYTPDRETPFAKAAAAIADPVTPPGDHFGRAFAAAAEDVIELAARRYRRRRLMAVVAVPAFLVAGGGAAAYAAVTIDWSSYWSTSTTTEWAEWAQSPDAVVTYTLPSGRNCELRLGEFAFSPADDRPADVPADPRALSAAVDFVHSSLVVTDADVQKAVAENRSDRNVIVDEDGDETPFGYGTGNDDADVEYDTAVPEAVWDAIDAHLSGMGLSSTGLTYLSQQQCSDETP